ncbi:hypothetical protein L596_007938 [Steinernema carpocapsae]|uniref:Uncharacterized protein n=1 Tax=Steinernema carpocapsae TaxID=34508 RepID=A0A4U5PAX0_STECR|nr:hypothetical protein L596_007938 [Steinernema carpocapsae]
MTIPSLAKVGGGGSGRGATRGHGGRSGGEDDFIARGKMNNSSRICCCNLRAAGVIVAFVEFLFVVLAVYGLIYNYNIFGSSYLPWFLIGIFSVIVILIAIILLLYAIKKESARLLIPHLSAQIFLILFLLIVALVVGLLLLFGAYKGIRRLLGHGDYYMTDDATITLGYTIIAVYLFIAILEIFFFIIIYKLYKYFKEYKLVPSKDPFLIEVGENAEVYTAQWQTPGQKSNYMYRGSPDAGDIYPYGPQQQI